jgi:hypothetical protein
MSTAVVFMEIPDYQWLATETTRDGVVLSKSISDDN